MAIRRVPIITVDEVFFRNYRLVSMYFPNAKCEGWAVEEYTTKILTGEQLFKLIEDYAKDNNIRLERITDFGVNVPRILLQEVKNPGIFKVPYSL